MTIKRLAVAALVCLCAMWFWHQAASVPDYDFSAPSKIDACQVGKTFTVYG